MTGEKNRYKTHEQLWKLEDGDLSTPQHDELVLQLLYKENAFKLLSFFGYDSSKWEYSIQNRYPGYNRVFSEDRGEYPHRYNDDSELHTNFDMFLYEAHQSLVPTGTKIYEEFMQETRNINVGINCEVPLVAGQNKFIMGYLDVQYKLSNFNLKIPLTPGKIFNFEYNYQRYPNCDPVLNNIKVSPVGGLYIFNNTFPHKEGECYINIEVKPKIKSFGETLRQINTYREISPNALYLIYSPDTRFKTAFETQGIRLITPSDLGLK